MALESVLHILKDGQEILNQRLEGEVMVGRSAGCAIRLDDRAISRNHLKLLVTGDGVQMEKRSDFSPVKVNGQEQDHALLKNGDQVGVGPYLMRLEIFEARTRQTHNDASSAEALPQASAIEIGQPAEAAASAGGDFLPFESDAKGRGGAGEFSLGLSSDASPHKDSDAGSGQSGDASVASLMMSSQSDGAVGGNVDGGDGNGFGEGGGDNQNGGQGGASPSVNPVISDDSAPIADDGRTRVASMERIEARLTFNPGSANYETYVLREQEISLGRGKICTIILNDKKASRKHAIIQRTGASFVIKDLQSANGIYVNGVKVDEQELSGGDRVAIGDVEFTFQATAADYQEENIPSAASILPDDDEIPSLDGMDNIGGLNGLSGFGGDAGQQPVNGIQDSAAQAAGANGLQLNFQQATPAGMANLNQINSGGKPKKQSMYEKYIRNFKDLNPRQKIMTVFMVASLTYFVFIEEEDKEIPQGRAPSSAQGGKAKTADQKKSMRDFGALPPDKQRFVDSQYNLAFDHLQNREFDKALYEVQKIFTYVDDYKDGKRLEQLAKDGKRTLEKLDEEKRRKEREEQVKVRVATLVDEAAELMKTKSYLQAREIFGEILALDPENARVAEWQKELQAFEEKKAIAAQKEEIEKATAARGWEVYQSGKTFQKKGQCHSAIAKFDEVLAIGSDEQKLNRLAAGGRRACVSWIKGKVAPHLATAKAAEAEQNYIGAFQGYRKVVQIDPPNKLGAQGIARVRDRLHEMAKVLYTEGIIAEDYSDLVTARARFVKIVESVPEDDRYYQSAARKLDRYKVLTQTLDEMERAPASGGGDSSSEAAEPAPGGLEGESQ